LIYLPFQSSTRCTLHTSLGSYERVDNFTSLNARKRKQIKANVLYSQDHKESGILSDTALIQISKRVTIGMRLSGADIEYALTGQTDGRTPDRYSTLSARRGQSNNSHNSFWFLLAYHGIFNTITVKQFDCIILFINISKYQ